MQKVLIGSSVIYENQHVSKVLHSPTTILLWQIFTILQIVYKKNTSLLPTTNCQKDFKNPPCFYTLFKQPTNIYE
jgi:hypothetical protein